MNLMIVFILLSEVFYCKGLVAGEIGKYNCVIVWEQELNHVLRETYTHD